MFSHEDTIVQLETINSEGQLNKTVQFSEQNISKIIVYKCPDRSLWSEHVKRTISVHRFDLKSHIYLITY